jgi:hypothetical protein
MAMKRGISADLPKCQARLHQRPSRFRTRQITLRVPLGSEAAPNSRGLSQVVEVQQKRANTAQF